MGLVACTTSPMMIMTISNGFVPRDYLNLELRHHQILFIVLMLYESVLITFRRQKYTFSFNLPNFSAIILQFVA